MKNHLYTKKHFKAWLFFGTSTILTTLLMDAAGVPAAYMIGAMLMGIFWISYVGDLKLDRRCANFSQAVVGLFIGSSLHLEMISGTTIPLYVSVLIVVTVLIFSLVTGIVVMRSRLLPGSTGIWGALPGAAPMMILMSEQQGADPSLVAFIQYTRVVLVAILASTVVGGTGELVEPRLVIPQETNTLAALAIIAFSMIVANITSSPAANFIVPIALAGTANFLNAPVLAPEYLLKIGFIVLGWSVGLRFTLQIRKAARRSFARVITMLALLIASCYAIGYALVLFFNVDPLTTYLATSPGGVDSIAVIAAGTSVDMPFIITVQMMRFIILLIWGPIIVRSALKFYNRLFLGHQVSS